MRVVGPDGSNPDFPDPVVLNAVDEIELLFIPDASRGQSFDPETEPEQFEDGLVRTQVTSDGRYQLRFDRDWVVERADRSGSDAEFEVDVPLYSVTDDAHSDVRDPTLRVTILRQDERIAENARFVKWPLPPGERERIRVRCQDGFEAQCLDEGPGSGM